MGYRTSYVLVTPLHEDAGQLDDLVTTIRAQELRPALWVVVDDGSSDGTERRLRRLAARDEWIVGECLPRSASGRRRLHAELLVHGIRRAAETAEAERIDPRFVVHVDPDLRCSPSLLAELIDRCDRDRSVGIGSCGITEVGEDGQAHRLREVVDGVPRAELRAWRRDCIEEVGMQPGPRWAESTAVRARNRGWSTTVFDDLVVEAASPGPGRDSLRGSWRHGAEGWQVGLHPLALAEEAVSASVSERGLRGVAMVAGYVEAAISRRRRSQDPELREYFGEDRLDRRARQLLSRVPVVGRRFRRRT